MDPIHWMVELEVKPGQEEALRTLVAEMVRDVQANERGAIEYEYYLTQDSKCHLFERYIDGTATIAHLEAFNRVFAARFIEVLQPLHFFVYGSPDAKVKEALTGFNPIYLESVGGFRR